MTATVSVRMDEELLDRLRKTARRERKSVNQIIVEAVGEQCASALEGQSAREALSGAIGIVDSGGGLDVARADDEFAEALEAHDREGRL
jgi:hypothetical protein